MKATIMSLPFMGCQTSLRTRTSSVRFQNTTCTQFTQRRLTQTRRSPMITVSFKRQRAKTSAQNMWISELPGNSG
uniref:Uncharacterized protein n=1 Tax=Anguilla anguilla TaxID=7936 RepID=A0A0E9SPL7_ANGAN